MRRTMVLLRHGFKYFKQLKTVVATDAMSSFNKLFPTNPTVDVIVRHPHPPLPATICGIGLH